MVGRCPWTADYLFVPRAEKIAYTACQYVCAPSFALPQNQYRPSVLFEHTHVVDIALDITVEFSIPEFSVCSGSSTSWTVVLMPETTVDEYHLLVSRKDQIRFPRKIAVVQSESESESMREFADTNFGRRVAGSYTRHQMAPLSYREVVRHDRLYVFSPSFVLLPTLHG